jgi:hypothetical protein
MPFVMSWVLVTGSAACSLGRLDERDVGGLQGEWSATWWRSGSLVCALSCTQLRCDPALRCWRGRDMPPAFAGLAGKPSKETAALARGQQRNSFHWPVSRATAATPQPHPQRERSWILEIGAPSGYPKAAAQPRGACDSRASPLRVHQPHHRRRCPSAPRAALGTMPAVGQASATAEALGYLGGAILSICVLPQVRALAAGGTQPPCAHSTHRRHPARQATAPRPTPRCPRACADLQDLHHKIGVRHQLALDGAVHQRPHLHLCLPGAGSGHSGVDPHDGRDRRCGAGRAAGGELLQLAGARGPRPCAAAPGRAARAAASAPRAAPLQARW